MQLRSANRLQRLWIRIEGLPLRNRAFCAAPVPREFPAVVPPTPPTPPPGASQHPQEEYRRRPPGSSFSEQHVSFHTNMRQMVKNGDNPAALEAVLQQMRDHDVQPTVRSYNHVLGAYARHGDAESIERLLRVMQEASVAPNVISFTALLQALARRSRGRPGSPAEAAKVLERMRKEGVEPSTVTYGILVDAWAKLGDIANAERTLEEMEATVGTSLASYNSLIHAHARVSNVQGALAVWERIKSKDLKLDVICFTTLIQAFTGAGDAEGAVRYLGEMESYGIQPNAFTLTLLMVVFAKRGDVRTVDTYWERLRELGLVPTAPAYNAVLQARAKAGDMESAMAWLATMRSVDMKPNINSYGIILDAAAAKGDLERCNELFTELKHNGLTPNRVILNTLIKAHMSARDFASGDRLLAEMRAGGEDLVPDLYTYNTLIWGRVRDGQIDEAKAYVEQMQAEGLTPGEAVLAVIGGGYRPPIASRTAPVALGVDWVEARGSGGERLYKRLSDGLVHTELPTAGLVQLTSDQGPYYWDASTGQTSWELPTKAQT